MQFWTPNLDGSDGDRIDFDVIDERRGSHDHSSQINTPDSTCGTGPV